MGKISIIEPVNVKCPRNVARYFCNVFQANNIDHVRTTTGFICWPKTEEEALKLLERVDALSVYWYKSRQGRTRTEKEKYEQKMRERRYQEYRTWKAAQQWT